MVIDDNFFMNLALKEAWRYQVLTYPNPAVGCCIVNGMCELLSVEAHHKAEEAHAEVLALQSAYYKFTQDDNIFSLTSSQDIHTYLISNHNNCFNNCTLYVTLEPCSHQGKTPSCADLLSKLHVKKVIIASLDETDMASGGEIILNKSHVLTKRSSLHAKSLELLYPFKKYNRDGFIFFKWAQRLNGTIDEGAISSLESRTLVHQMRDVCDLLVIGANTVRMDRPTLDARLVNGHAPDVLILSKTKEIDKTIPLFNVKTRKVMIEDNFEKLKDYRCIMIEGGAIMFELCKQYVDYYLCFVASKSGGNKIMSNQKYNFNILHVEQISEDILMWMKLKNQFI